ncbi:hypothetical protein KBK24_0119920 [Burkholderia sp. K24]|nr:hypothetical protein KBK24_0119920 [Burkholderia sp. K24]
MCSQAPVNQQPVEFTKHRNCDAWLAQRHGRTHDAIQHPRRHHPHYAWTGLDVHHATATSLLDVSYLDATPIQGMPTVMDFNFLPDMGRMIANLLSVEKTSCTSVPTAAANVAPQSIPWSVPPN